MIELIEQSAAHRTLCESVVTDLRPLATWELELVAGGEALEANKQGLNTF